MTDSHPFVLLDQEKMAAIGSSCSHTHIASQVRAAILPDLSSFSLQYQRYLRGDDRCWGVIGKPGTQVKLKPDLILTSSKADLSVHLREASGT